MKISNVSFPLLGQNNDAIRLEQTPSNDPFEEYYDFNENSSFSSTPSPGESKVSNGIESNKLEIAEKWLLSHKLLILISSILLILVFILILSIILCRHRNSSNMNSMSSSDTHPFNYSHNNSQNLFLSSNYNNHGHRNGHNGHGGNGHGQGAGSTNTPIIHPGIKKFNYLGNNSSASMRNENLNFSHNEDSPFLAYQHKFPERDILPQPGFTMKLPPLQGQNMQNMQVHQNQTIFPQNQVSQIIPQAQIAQCQGNYTSTGITYQACFPNQTSELTDAQMPDQNTCNSTTPVQVSKTPIPDPMNPNRSKSKTASGDTSNSKNSASNRISNSNYSISSGYGSAFRPYSKSNSQDTSNLNVHENTSPLAGNSGRSQSSSLTGSGGQVPNQPHQPKNSINILHFKQNNWNGNAENANSEYVLKQDQFVVAI